MISKIIRRLIGKRSFKNRFEKFYYLNKAHVSRYRKKRYYEKIQKGIGIKCKKKAIKGINFCAYHRAQTKKYNNRARRKR